jgi:N-dimethylarginine dimethylaminohydrolase
MCPPEYFGVQYVINPWMKGNTGKVDHALAMKQWRALYDILQDLDDVALIDPHPSVPDMVFTANAALVFEDQAFISNFRHSERKMEEIYFTSWFRDKGWLTTIIKEGAAFEGAGDALIDTNNVLWLGYGHRTEYATKESLLEEKENGFLSVSDIKTLKLVDERFYHLDTCFCPLDQGHALYYPAAFSEVSQDDLQEAFGDNLIEVSEKDALAFACNAVSTREYVVLNRASYSLQKTLSDLGYTVFQTPLSEFMKAGGSAKCLTLKLEVSDDE